MIAGNLLAMLYVKLAGFCDTMRTQTCNKHLVTGPKGNS